MSVLIVGLQQRKNAEGEPFNALLLESGEVELITSSISGNVYATARRTSITCTFNNQRCEILVGKSLPGKIERTACDEYDFNIPGTKETVKLKHTWKFNPEPSTVRSMFLMRKLNRRWLKPIILLKRKGVISLWLLLFILTAKYTNMETKDKLTKEQFNEALAHFTGTLHYWDHPFYKSWS